jgi:hypothetical protein
MALRIQLPPKLKKFRMIIKIGLISLGLVLSAIDIYRLSEIPSVKDAIVLATTVKPETFTELYFEDHTNLPHDIEINAGNQFAFTVHNLEGKDMTYDYVVYVQTIDRKETMARNSFTLKNGASISIQENYTLRKKVHLEVIVELINKNQSIDFWMD